MRETKFGRGRLLAARPRLEALEDRSLLSANPLIDAPVVDPSADLAPVEVVGDVEMPEDALVCQMVPEDFQYTCDVKPGDGDFVEVTDVGVVEEVDPSLFDVGVEPVDPELFYCTFMITDPVEFPDPVGPAEEWLEQPVDLDVIALEDKVVADPIDDVTIRRDPGDLVYFPVEDVTDPNGGIFYAMSPVALGDLPASPLSQVDAPAIDTSMSSASAVAPVVTPIAATPPKAARPVNNSPLAIALGSGQKVVAVPDGPKAAKAESPRFEPPADAAVNPIRSGGVDSPATPTKVAAKESRPDGLVVAVDQLY